MRSTRPFHRPVDAERHAAIVAFITRCPNSRAWSALNAPGDYIYDDPDHIAGTGLDLQCDELRLAFGRVTEWEAMAAILARLTRLDSRRRRMSIGVRIDGREYMGEAI